MKHFVTTTLLAAWLILIPALVIAADTPVPGIAAEGNMPAIAIVPPVIVKPVKIGFFDITYIGTESDYGKSIKARLLEKKGKIEKKILSEKKKLDSLKDAIEAKLQSYTPQQREAKSKEFQKKVETFQKSIREAEESLMKEQENETGTLFSLIEKTVTEYGKANDFAIIAIKKDILYVANGVDAQDLTSIILKAVNDSGKNK
jgi:outer membrane protein